jgi:hypothetical protein
MPPRTPSFSAARRLGIRLSVLLGLLAALAITVMLNYLAARHTRQFDLTGRGAASLSPQSLRVLATLTNDTQITLFFDARSNPTLYSMLDRLLRNYTDASPRLTVRSVDPTREPGDAELVLATYQLGSVKDRNFLVLETQGRSRVLYEQELADHSVELVAEGPPREFRKSLRAFKAEPAITTALFNLANPRRYRIGFTTGHGEHDPDRSGHPHGYSKLAQMIREKTGAEIQKLSLAGTNEIPTDCQLLVIAGPQQPFAPVELERLEKYLRGGGRLLALISNPIRGGRAGLENVLARWNVAVGDTIILDPPNTPEENSLLTAQLNQEQPITRGLMADDPEHAHIRLVLPRPIGLIRAGPPAPDVPDVQILAFTSKEGIEASEVRGGALYRNPATDQTGAFPLLVAAEQGSLPNVTAERGAMRMVVAGDSLFLDNELIDSPPANRLFAALAISWLLDRPPVLLEGLVPQPVASYQVVVTRRDLRSAQWVLLGAVPGGILLLGALVAWRRGR